jgi:antitoxin ParD1/3/4
MNVSLTPELDEFVAGKVESGRYTSASEVVREALRLLEEHDRAKIASVNPEEFVDPKAARARLLQRARERRNVGK